jgi:hypothetical protein
MRSLHVMQLGTEGVSRHICVCRFQGAPAVAIEIVRNGKPAGRTVFQSALAPIAWACCEAEAGRATAPHLFVGGEHGASIEVRSARTFASKRWVYGVDLVRIDADGKRKGTPILIHTDELGALLTAISEVAYAAAAA